MPRRIIAIVRTQGIRGALRAVTRRLLGYRPRSWALCRALVEGRQGIEIGGPSPIFSPGHLLPLYPLVGALDNCNYAASTLWQGEQREGREFRFSPAHAPGVQLIREATDLSGVASERYDFVLSSHALEHVANPLAALREWRRVLKPGGALVLVLPHGEGTFDHRRPVTTLAHLQRDLEVGAPETDLTHLDEILALHDLARDPGAGGRAAFEARCRQNARHRGLHHHVFDTRLVAELVGSVGLHLGALEAVLPYHVIALAVKPRGGEAPPPPDEELVRASLAASPFARDRRSAAAAPARLRPVEPRPREDAPASRP